MIETTVRHPRLVAALAGLCAVVVAVALIGPRDSSVVGVGGAGAADDLGQTSSSTTQPGDDGVVLTAPGELETVIEGPVHTANGEVGIAGPPPASSVAPSADTTDVAAGENEAGPTSSTTSDQPTSTAEVPPTSASPGPGATPTSAPTPLGENAATVIDGVNASASELLLAAPELSGVARGSTIEQEPLIAQVGTRDSNSVPWMLLIAANFGIAVFALALLRLRR